MPEIASVEGPTGERSKEEEKEYLDRTDPRDCRGGCTEGFDIVGLEYPKGLWMGVMSHRVKKWLGMCQENLRSHIP